MTEQQIPQIIDFVRQQIKERYADLKLEEKSYGIEDDWLYLTVTPSRDGVRASDYAKEMSDIEKELRARHFDNVLLIPTIEE